MAQFEVKLPSGATGIIRGLKGREINMFANSTAAKSSKTALQILKSVWVQTNDSGPLYSGDVDWDIAPQCDRFYALLYARIATWKSDYEIVHKCSDCGKKFEWVVPLTDLPVKPLPDASVAAFKDGNKFYTKIEDGSGVVRRVTFQLMTPKLEAKAAEVQSMSTTEKITVGLAQRIVEVEGLDAGKGSIKEFLNELDAGSLFDLIGAMDEVDGGVETQIEVECNHCGNEDSIDLPLDTKHFWSPRRGKP